MNYKERKEFRSSKKWKAFKAKCRLHSSKDYITNEPLMRGWNLHHLDLKYETYTVLEIDRFMCLNTKTHELIHELFKLYKKDKKVIDRIRETLEKMSELTNQKSDVALDLLLANNNKIK